MYVTKHCVRSGVQVGFRLKLLAHGNRLVLVLPGNLGLLRQGPTVPRRRLLNLASKGALQEQMVADTFRLPE
jgi:hypothetical protein